MSVRRKTIEVETIKRLANTQLARQDISRDARLAVAGMLEALLFEANAYDGYNHFYWSKEGGYEAWCEAGRPEGEAKREYMYGNLENDDSRRIYY